MRVLIACEESQEVCKAFRAKGHEAYSCDIIPCSGGFPEWHIQDDVLRIINGYERGYGVPFFVTNDGKAHSTPERWDLIIAHPPCTDLAVSGARSFEEKRKDGRQQQSIAFFMNFVTADCEKVAIENPIGIMSTVYRKPDQIIQPWQYAINEWEQTVKSTCLWLKGLDKLKPVHTTKPEIQYKEWFGKNGKVGRQTMWYYNTRCMGPGKRGKAASKTFPGIAKAMADQWG